MFCKNCGEKVSSEVNFCKKCGHETSDSLDKTLHKATKKVFSWGRFLVALFVSFVVFAITIRVFQVGIKFFVIIFLGFFGFHSTEFTANADAIGNIFGLVGSFYLAQKVYRSINKK